MKHTKWAIIGLGKMANKFAQDLNLVNGAELVAIASRDISKANDFGDAYNVKNRFGNYEELLFMSEIDIVYIATPHVYHTPLAKMFINNGFSVLCEKPIAMNTAELEELIAVARKKDVFLMEAIWTRFFPTFQKAMDIVHSGAIGDVVSIRADFGFKSKEGPESRIFNKSLGGGALLDVGLYPLFLALNVLGEPDDIKTVSTWTETGVDASTGMLLSYGKTKMAELYSSVVAETKVEGEIFGTKGKLILHSRFHHASKLTWQIYGEEEQVFNSPYEGNGYQYEIEEVVNCLQS